MEEIVKCDHSNKSYCGILSYGTDTYAEQERGGSKFKFLDITTKLDNSNES